MRQWTFDRLEAHAPLLALLPAGVGGILQHRSFTNVPKQKPFLTYRLGVSQPEVKDDNVTIAMSTPIQIWVHDEPGNYLAIDAILEEVKGWFEVAVADGSLIRAHWQEHSEDLSDPDMGTILRFSRYRLVHKP